MIAEGISFKARAEGLADIADVTFASVLGLNDSELEDMYELSFYKGLIWNQYKVSLDSPHSAANGSGRIAWLIHSRLPENYGTTILRWKLRQRSRGWS